VIIAKAPNVVWFSALPQGFVASGAVFTHAILVAMLGEAASGCAH